MSADSHTYQPRSFIQTATPSKCDPHLWPDRYSKEQILIITFKVKEIKKKVEGLLV